MKKILLTLVLLLIAVGSAFGAYQYYIASTVGEAEVYEVDVAENIPESAYEYTIAEGSTVTYVIKKNYFNQDDQLVPGVSEDIYGRGWFDPETQTGNVQINLDFRSFATDNPQRDANASNMFESQEIIFIADLSNLEISADEQFDLNVPAKLTLNNITNDIEFNVVGVLDSDTLTVEGQSSILLTDYNIEIPSMMDVFRADNEIQLEFNVVAVRGD